MSKKKFMDISKTKYINVNCCYANSTSWYLNSGIETFLGLVALVQ